MFWLWLGIVITLALIEIITVNLTTVWFVISGIISMLVSLFTGNYYIQFAIFVIVGAILLIFTKPYFLKKIKIHKESTNLDRVIGMIGIVTEDITRFNPGEVKVDGKRWTAIAEKEIKKDASVRVKKIDGVKIIVEEV